MLLRRALPSSSVARPTLLATGSPLLPRTMVSSRASAGAPRSPARPSGRAEAAGPARSAPAAGARLMSTSAPRSAPLKIPGENELVKSNVAGNARTVTLSRTSALNALNLEMVTLLRKELALFLASQTTGILVLNHAGRAFCSGGDVLAVVKAADGDEARRIEATHFFKKEYELDYALARLGQFSARSAVAGKWHDKTAVALLDGITMGGGVGLSSHLPFRVVTEKTLWAMPETGIGFFPDVGVARILARLDGGVGLYLALTGHRLQGWETYYLGLGTHYVRSSSIPRLTEALHLTQQEPPTSPTHDKPPNVTSRVHDVLEEYSIDPLDQANEETSPHAMRDSPFFGPQRVALDYIFGTLTYPRHNVSQLFTALEQLIAPLPWTSPAGKAIASGQYGFFSNSSQAWDQIAQWAKDTLAVLKTKSPRSLVVTHRHLAEAAGNVRLPQSFDLDMRRCTAFCDLHAPPQGSNRDFYTGVTHVLEKDPATGKRRQGPPAWNPASVDEVNISKVSSLFFSDGKEAKAYGMNLPVPELDLVSPRQVEREAAAVRKAEQERTRGAKAPQAQAATQNVSSRSQDEPSWRLTPARDGDNTVPDTLGPLGWAPTHNPFALPSEAECAALLAGEHPGAGSTQPSAQELVTALDAFHGPKPGLKRKVLEWASRMTEPEA